MRALFTLPPALTLALVALQILYRATREYREQSEARAAEVYRACVKPGAE